jgi:hypothetical protein
MCVNAVVCRIPRIKPTSRQARIIPPRRKVSSPTVRSIHGSTFTPWTGCSSSHQIIAPTSRRLSFLGITIDAVIIVEQSPGRQAPSEQRPGPGSRRLKQVHRRLIFKHDAQRFIRVGIAVILNRVHLFHDPSSSHLLPEFTFLPFIYFLFF